jgi:Spy/CpxP family protein refolding chaperone
MRTIIKKTVLGLLVIVLSGGYIFAQESSSAHGQSDKRGTGMSKFSDQQKEMIKQRAEKQKAYREIFKASISDQQKNILEDPRVMPVERQKAFRASLTDQQVSMIKSHRDEMKNLREQFRATLTPEQKAMINRMRMGRRTMNGHGFRGGMNGNSDLSGEIL